ncbi:BLUF domain-containing protein [Maribacter sp. 2-571]|uniref:BLUF domain-containing protein n=1 Tax=Maribacter sp. 2-571 TaxID=3417569 RepID=UPI003D33B177
MFNLVYRSKARLGISQDAVQQMLEAARSYNRSNDITGCLLFYEGAFLQYLEGNQIKVLRLFDKIKESDMHTDIEILSHGHIETREFDDWEMAFENFMGTKHQLQYLLLLVSSYVENPKNPLQPNPASINFWHVAKQLLRAKATF